MSCLSIEQIENLIAERVREPLLGQELAHLQQCTACARLLDECKANRDLMHDLSDAFSSLPSAPEVRIAVTDGLDVRSSKHSSSCRSEPRDPSLPPDDIPGYQLIREIHRGGQGVVYEAVQESTRRTVAVKVMLEGHHADERARWRFEREVRLVAGLKHPNIVAIHDSGIAQGRYYFAMDYVRGQPLDTHVRLTGPTIRQIVQIMATVCDAVSYAHRRGIIHRDLKPSNVLVGEDGIPQVLDFGLAKLTVAEEDERHSFKTMPGHILGTIRYMSPEQTRGDLDAIDTRTDVYSLGFILYELLTGVSPYETGADLMETFRNIREVDPQRPSRVRRDINSDLDAITLKAMQKEPERRYSSAEELRQDLLAWLEGRPISARSDSSFYVLRKLAARHYFHTSVIVALMASIVAFSAISLQALHREKQAKSRLEQINTEFVTHINSLQQQVTTAAAKQHEGMLGYFLLEWHAGRAESAKSIQQQLPPGSPEAAVAHFLTEEGMTEASLRSTPGMSDSLALFAIGERLYAEGKWEQARRVFADYVSRYRGFYQSLAQARVNQIQAQEGTHDGS